MRVKINIGATGTGKTYITASQLKKYKLKRFVHDIGGEYKWMKGVNSFFLEKTSDLIKFVNTERLKNNSVFAFEEAHLNFPNDSTKREMMPLIQALIRKRHDNCVYIFNYHTFGQIPLWLYDYTDFVNIKQSGDRFGEVAKKYGKNSAFNKLHLFTNFLAEIGYMKSTVEFNVRKKKIDRISIVSDYGDVSNISKILKKEEIHFELREKLFYLCKDIKKLI